jgi:hypothetical protein
MPKAGSREKPPFDTKTAKGTKSTKGSTPLRFEFEACRMIAAEGGLKS